MPAESDTNIYPYIIPKEIINIILFQYFDLTTLSYKFIISDTYLWQRNAIESLKAKYLAMSQLEFGRVFAESIFFENNFLTGVLKSIIDDETNSLKPDLYWCLTLTDEKTTKLQKIELDNYTLYNIHVLVPGTSLFYFVIENDDYALAHYLLSHLETDGRFSDNIITKKKAHKSKKLFKKIFSYHVDELHSKSDYNTDECWSKDQLVNLGYYNSDDDVSFSPLVYLINHESSDNDTACLIKRLISLGGEVEAHSRYHLDEDISENDYFELYEIDSLREERKYRRELLCEIQAKYSSCKKQLAILKEENCQLAAENNELKEKSREVHLLTKKRKRKLLEKTSPETSPSFSKRQVFFNNATKSQIRKIVNQIPSTLCGYAAHENDSLEDQLTSISAAEKILNYLKRAKHFRTWLVTHQQERFTDACKAKDDGEIKMCVALKNGIDIMLGDDEYRRKKLLHCINKHIKWLDERKSNVVKAINDSPALGTS